MWQECNLKYFSFGTLYVKSYYFELFININKIPNMYKYPQTANKNEVGNSEFVHQRIRLIQSYASLYGDQNTKNFIANKTDTVGAVKRPPARMQPERERERKTKTVHYIENDEGLLNFTELNMSIYF